MKINQITESSLEEVDRRGFLKGLGAAAVAGAAGDVKADRFWQQDELTKQWQGQMTSETFAGAVIHWNEERQVASLALTEPTNFSINNVKQNRLYFPKFTSTSFTIKIGDSKPFNGTGYPYTFPLRQLGDYKGNGLTLLSGKNFASVRDEFVNADKVLVRVEIDGHPTTLTFHDNPGHIQQRQNQRKQPILDKISQEEEAGSKVPGFHGIYSAIQMRGMLEQYKDVPSIAKPYDELNHEVKLLAALTRGHKISQDIEAWTQQDNQLSKARPTNTTTLVNWYADVYPHVMSRLKKYNAMLSDGVKESVEQGTAEGSLNEFAPPGSGDGGDDGFSEETLKRLAAQWYNGDEDPRVERTLMAAGWEIGQDEGYDDEPGVFVVQSGDVNGNSYLSWPAHELKQGMAEGKPEKPEQPEADYGDDYQAMVSRVKKLAGLGPLKTVYDPQKRVYKNVPKAEQPKK